MNKIYFENSCIHFCKKPSSELDYDLKMAPRDLKNYITIVDALKNKKKPIQILIQSDQFEKYFQSFIGNFQVVEAAGGLVLNEKGEILFIEKREFLDLPKGKIDHGESAKNAAIREVEEETGARNLKIINKTEDSFHFFQYKNQDIQIKKTQWFIMSCGDSNHLHPQEKEGITKVYFEDPKKALEQSKRTYSSIQDVLIRSGFL